MGKRRGYASTTLQPDIVLMDIRMPVIDAASSQARYQESW